MGDLVDEAVFQALLAGLGTCLGAALIIMCGRMGTRSFSFFLGLASGIMTAVVLLDLLPSAFQQGRPMICLLGFITGFALVGALDIFFSKFIEHPLSHRNYLAMGYLIAIGIALHDLPEGLAIAAGFATPGSLGPLLALSIGLHNIPEGMATAAPLRAGGMSRLSIILLAALVSLVTPIGTLLGLILISTSPLLLSGMLAFAAGAMTYIVKDKLLPESKRLNQSLAYTGIMAGFSLMSAAHLFL